MAHALLRVLPVGLAAALAAALASAASAQPACDCRHLGALQAELRNAQRLQAAFRGHMTPLRGMGQETSRAELQRFAGSDARRGLEPVQGATQQSEVDYVPYGEGVSVDRIGDNTPERNAQLCAMRESSAADLARAIAGAACAGIGEALRAHERHHVAMCTRVGYRGYIAMHGADRAQEEAEAYGAQIAVLRQAIARALENATIRVESEMNSRMQMPANPLYQAIIVDHRGEVRASRASMSGDVIRFEGRGQQRVNASVQGNCSFTSGVPYTVATTGGIETDGITATLRYAIEGATPGMTMTCRVPGGGQGMGMSMPVPVVGAAPSGLSVPLRDGAEVVEDMANSDAARMMAGSGVRMSGQAKMRLRVECPAR